MPPHEVASVSSSTRLVQHYVQVRGVGRVVGALGSEAGFAGSMLN